MKRIVFLCDGTWNNFDRENPTNVIRTSQALRLRDDHGHSQIPLYFHGVGTGMHLDRFFGGAFGRGLMANVVAAYRNLVFLYEPGDEICVFGFSRGAHTARSLIGLIRSTGILDRQNLHLMPQILERYSLKSKETHPGSEDSHRFRLSISPHFATSKREQRWRKGRWNQDSVLVKIPFVGLWDCVGSLGVPHHLNEFPLLDRIHLQNDFHDTQITKLVKRSRHAVALDERRPSFEPLLMKNSITHIEARKNNTDTHQELWFPGTHGAIGGGGEVTDISSITLSWIIQGAEKAGLSFDDSMLKTIEREHNPLGHIRPFRKQRKGLKHTILRWGSRDRDGPESLEDLHDSAITRWLAGQTGQGPKYEPQSLDYVKNELETLLWKHHHEHPKHIVQNVWQQAF